MNTKDLLIEKEEVVEWLKLIGSTPTDVNNVGEDSEWHIEFDYPTKSPQRMHIVCPEQKPHQIIIANGLNISPNHIRAFDEMPSNEKREFLFRLKYELSNSDYDFKVEGAKSELDCPTVIQFSKVKFGDGLTLDSFAESIGVVFKAKVKSIFLINLILQEPDSSDNKFDFKTIQN